MNDAITRNFSLIKGYFEDENGNDFEQLVILDKGEVVVDALLEAAQEEIAKTSFYYGDSEFNISTTDIIVTNITTTEATMMIRLLELPEINKSRPYVGFFGAGPLGQIVDTYLR